MFNFTAIPMVFLLLMGAVTTNGEHYYKPEEIKRSRPTKYWVTVLNKKPIFRYEDGEETRYLYAGDTCLYSSDIHYLSHPSEGIVQIHVKNPKAVGGTICPDGVIGFQDE